MTRKCINPKHVGTPTDTGFSTDWCRLCGGVRLSKAAVSVEYEAKLVYLQGQSEPILGCSCHYCDNEWRRVMDELDPDGWMQRMSGMILCPDCGCKRCPKATYHGHDCTGSNDPGQAGSVYGGFELDTSWMGDPLDLQAELADIRATRDAFRAKHNLTPAAVEVDEDEARLRGITW